MAGKFRRKGFRSSVFVRVPSTPSSSKFLRDVRIVRLGAPIAPRRPTDIALAPSHADSMAQIWSPRLWPCRLWPRSTCAQIPWCAHIEEFSLARFQGLLLVIGELDVDLLSVATSAAPSIRRSPSIPASCLYSLRHSKAILHICCKQNGSSRIYGKSTRRQSH